MKFPWPAFSRNLAYISTMKIKINHLLGAALSLLITFGLAHSSMAQVPDPRIVFSHQVSHQICSMNSDGSETVTLTSGYGSFPAWSFDQRYILFHRATTAEDTIYIMDALGERNGGRIFPVIHDGGGNTGVDWSPDASMIVFSGTAGIEEGLWIMAVNPDTEELGTPILARPGPAAAPVWSPDGTKIAFVSYPGAIGKVLDLNTGVETYVAGLNAYAYAPSFSPNGQQLAFMAAGPVTKANKTTWHPQIFVVNVDGTGKRQVTKQTDYVNFPKWSPDSTQIAYWRQANDMDSINKVTLATGASALLKKGGNILDWAP
jgi:Tol biopolymer transport system component